MQSRDQLIPYERDRVSASRNEKLCKALSKLLVKQLGNERPAKTILRNRTSQFLTELQPVKWGRER